MPNIKKLAFVVLWLFMFNISFAADIKTDSVVVVDDKTIDFTLTNDFNQDIWEIAWDVKVLSDMEIISSERDLEDSKKVNIFLWWWKVAENTSYSLLTVVWAEWSIDFETKEDFVWAEILNTEALEAQWIESVVIRDPLTIEVFYKDVLSSTEFEYKLLANIEVNKIEKLAPDNNDVRVSLSSKLQVSRDYILMLINLMDKDEQKVDFNDGIFDFSTLDTIKETPDEIIIEENPDEAGWENGETVETVSLNAAETPDTWPETTVLIALTFILSSIVLIRRKILRK